ncbi:protein of unknown function [Nitrosotalea devaniterrae]|uniref:Uncharacterized protein n=1 Tax=Nitrosotalea devaniterrae TaxID=1078905 RepID=A0A128A1M0_9ARCH|nr:protein of unknown function [Candidatus Nitrosotalea devanaterra]
MVDKIKYYFYPEIIGTTVFTVICAAAENMSPENGTISIIM